MATTTAPVTFAEFEALPEIPGKQELLDGEVITLPPPQAGHSNVSHALYDVLRTAVQGQGSSPSAERVVFLEAGYRVSRNPDAFLQPDVSIQYPDQQIIEGYFERSAMLAVDVVSPSNTAHHWNAKPIATSKAVRAKRGWSIRNHARCGCICRTGRLSA
jgi:Uma2 family endonuclease